METQAVTGDIQQAMVTQTVTGDIQQAMETQTWLKCLKKSPIYERNKQTNHLAAPDEPL
jgi:hypothetical protein